MISQSIESVSGSEKHMRAIPLCWHIITSEYPPQSGGISDYTALVAEGLATEGDEVHVWCPPCSETFPQPKAVVVHRDLGAIRPRDLRRISEQLDQFSSPRRILIQWVPHGYGYRSMNLPLCWWLRNRALQKGDHVEIMLHEPYLTFRMTSPRQSIAALVHRLMTVVLLAAAERVWVAIPAWEKSWRPYALGRAIPFRWLPVPSNIPIVDNPGRFQGTRQRYVTGDEVLIGHFGTFGWPITSVLEPVLIALAGDPGPRKILLMGQGSKEYRQALVQKSPRLEGLVCAAGALDAIDLSCHVKACDVLIQPYPDGVSSRRSSLMVGLSHGKPVIANLGALSEPFWKETRALALAPTLDGDSFVRLLHEVGMDAGERDRMGQAARRLYEERFDISHTVAALRERGIF